MASDAAQVPLPDVLKLRQLENGSYSTLIPPSMCFGSVSAGGAILSWTCKAAIHYLANTTVAAGQQHKDVVHYAVNFIRPVFCDPKEARVSFEVVSSGVLSTILQLKVSQGGKKCLVGHITLSNLAKTLPGALTQRHSWQLSPPPIAAPPDFEDLENDKDRAWSRYRVPYLPNSTNQAQSYIVLAAPRWQSSPAILDMWMSPGWTVESQIPPRWTNETIHFLLDAAIPPMYSLIDSGTFKPTIALMWRAAQAQKEARLAGRSDQFVGEGLTLDDAPVAMVTATMSTEIKQRLPAEGTRWLFLRVTCKRLLNSRCDHSIEVLDVHNDLIAIGQHTMVVVPIKRKLQDQASKL